MSGSSGQTKIDAACRGLFQWSNRHPVLAIAIVSFVTLLVNCYPIIFCGRSFVAPTFPQFALVYDSWPTLPQIKSPPPPELGTHGSDTAAMALWGVPAGFIESRSIWEQGEIPLWNRYGHAGETFLGQAISMLGDPLQWIVIGGRGSALAWDIKFLAAKFLFCFGFGLLVLRLLKNIPLSLIYTALAAYCGAFFFIYNHPVFFVFCYAPWILLSALELFDLQSKSWMRWGLVWLITNVACFNAGHVEVAVDLIGGLNAAVLIYVLLTFRGGINLAKSLARLGIGTAIFLGITAPFWMSFLGALENSYSSHSQARVDQLFFPSAIGAFDDIFYQQLLKNKANLSSALAPGTSLLIMVGALYSLLKWRFWKGHPFFWINSAAILFWGACIFGIVPASILMAIPFLNRVNHIYMDFSYLLVIHLMVQSAYGFKVLAGENCVRPVVIKFVIIGAIFCGAILLYNHFMTHYSLPANYLLCAAAGAFSAPLLFVYLRNRKHGLSVSGCVGIVILGFIPHFRFGLYTGGNDEWLIIPSPRVALNVPSPSIEKIKMDDKLPFRVFEMGGCFNGDYSAAYDFEGIHSCAPLSNRDFITLVQKFPGINFSHVWVIDLIDPIDAHALLNMLNVKYLLAPPTAHLRDGIGFRAVDCLDFCIVENQEAWPRAFFSDKIVSVSDNSFVDYLVANGTRPFIALTPEEIQQKPLLARLETTHAPAISPASNYRLLQNSTAFDIHASSAGIVCLTEEYAAGFTASVNGKPAEIIKVNHAFKGVYLDRAGDYHVEFVYRPWHWRLACILFWSAIGCCILLAAGVLLNRIKQSSTSANPANL